MSEKIIARFYIETGTDACPYTYDVPNVERAAKRCGINLACLAEAFRSLPENARISMDWRPEEKGPADVITYVFELEKDG